MPIRSLHGTKRAPADLMKPLNPIATSSGRQTNSTDPRRHATPTRTLAAPAAEASDPTSAAMERAGLPLHAPSRQHNLPQAGASSSSAPTLHRSMQMDRSQPSLAISAIAALERAASLTPPCLNDTERGRFHFDADDSPQLAQRQKPALQALLNQWLDECKQTCPSWQKDLDIEIARIKGADEHSSMPTLLQETANALRTAAEPGKDALKVHYTPLPHLPSDVSQFTHLSKIEINAAALQSLPDSIGKLHNLRELTLSNNPLKALPESLGELAQLQTLAVTDSKNLRELPHNLVGRRASGGTCGLTRLKILNLHGSNVRSLPSSVTLMRELQQLDLSKSPVLSLPDEIEKMQNLRELNLENTPIEGLPRTLCHLPALKNLNLENCVELRALPKELGQLRKLESLNLRGCTNLNALPVSIKQLPDNCDIKVPQRLEAQLANLRQPNADRAAAARRRNNTAYSVGFGAPARPALATGATATLAMRHPARAAAPGASASTNAAGPSKLPDNGPLAQRTKSIQTRARAALALIDEGKNPFVPGNPSFGPTSEKRNRPMTLGEIGTLRQMLQESKDYANADFLHVETPIQTPSGKICENTDEIDRDNLVACMRMWQAREYAVLAKANYRDCFPEVELYVPKQADAHAHPQPAQN
ncbi:leucine-rich repeat domain-containing protein [Xanthomonas cerealis pv. cerealis]|uniref:leucine-rich repeat domain-containing protein n=1 Tax=Xanthomonas cerealis TaxID=3390025 RepID=UPI001F35D97C|nr:leucine-rich repeat domain-containing protein [Xanthomonas translucens]UKE70541.1 leucine-rich repeat domain-containing protein [Xanthomonas translucens pv. pistacia]